MKEKEKKKATVRSVPGHCSSLKRRGGEEAKDDRGRIGRGVAGEEVEEKLSSSATSCSSAFNFLLTDLRLKSLTNRLLHLTQNFILTFKIIQT